MEGAGRKTIVILNQPQNPTKSHSFCHQDSHKQNFATICLGFYQDYSKQTLEIVLEAPQAGDDLGFLPSICVP